MTVSVTAYSSARPHVERAPGRLGRGGSRHERDSVRHALLRPRVRRDRRGRPRHVDHRPANRHLVPHARPGAGMGSPDGRDHLPLDGSFAAPRGRRRDARAARRRPRSVPDRARATCSRSRALAVVGEAATGADAVRASRELAPDVVVMDLNMPGISGVEATRQIAALAPLDPRGRADDLRPGRRRHGRDPRRRVRLPAQGLVDPRARRRHQRGRGRRVADLARTSRRRCSSACAPTSAAPEIAETIRAELSDRELEVLKLIANGKDNAADRAPSCTSARRRSRTTSRTS